MSQQIFVRTQSGDTGPFTPKELRAMASRGDLRPSDQISLDGMTWGTASGLKGLAFPGAATPQPPELPARPVSRPAPAAPTTISRLRQAAAAVSNSVSSSVSQIQTELETTKRTQMAIQEGKLSALQRYLNEEQDPKIIESTVPRIQQFLTSEEELLYVTVQKKPVANIAPDCVALTTRRIIFFTVKLFGQLSFKDHLWRNVGNVTVKEGILGANFSATVTDGQKVGIDYLPKAQARMLYRFAQEMEEMAIEDRRNRMMEESRAAAGGVVVQNAFVPPKPTESPLPSEDPVATLQKLKTMLDAGLISAAEFAAKKAEILKRM